MDDVTPCLTRMVTPSGELQVGMVPHFWRQTVLPLFIYLLTCLLGRHLCHVMLWFHPIRSKLTTVTRRTIWERGDALQPPSTSRQRHFRITWGKKRQIASTLQIDNNNLSNHLGKRGHIATTIQIDTLQPPFKLTTTIRRTI